MKRRRKYVKSNCINRQANQRPEIKLVGKDQNSVVRFILAVNRPKYGDSKPQADFIPVVAWRGTADFIGRNFRKGKQVYVSQIADYRMGKRRSKALRL